MGGGVCEAGDLLILGGEVADGVEDEVDEPEASRKVGCGHVADRHADALAAGLGPEPGRLWRWTSRFRAPSRRGCEREGHPAGTDGELQRRSVPGQLRQLTSTVGPRVLNGPPTGEGRLVRANPPSRALRPLALQRCP